MSGYTEVIRNEILELPCNQIFVAHELKKEKFSDFPEAIYYKALERMVKQNQLVHLAKGLYYRPMMDHDDIVPISDKTIVDYYISDNSGALVGEGLFIEKGIATGFEKRLSFISNKLSENKKKIGNIEVHRTEIELNEKTIPVIEALEILQNYYKIPNINKREFISYIHDFVDDYSDEVTEYVLSKCKYKKSTIAFLARILDWYGLAHSMHEYLSPLSDYKIPSIDELRLEIPEDINNYLITYTRGLKNIYKEHLLEVILYGSYARGNYGYDSDIDVMIIVDLPDEEIKKYRHKISGYTYDINTEYDIDIKSMTKNNEIFSKWEHVYPFYKNVRTEGVHFYGAA